ncbi:MULTISPECIES: hypothetical protein [unclassified Streptomyces]|uniref:hypothetical protein n=1 Tax=unclassified Streptomyces TaxID=2593676 RepID=UPI000F451A23|nr:hypothetical protein [Streptomyces sp. I6]RNL73889.1 hypothetical protein EBF04_29550 [Streptomyces sp. I6]
MSAQVIQDITSQARKTWRRLGVDEGTASEMAEELTADLTAAALDGQDARSYIAGDVEVLATSWAVERGLVASRRRLKETALAAANGAALPALAAMAFWWVGWSRVLDCSFESVATMPDGSLQQAQQVCSNAGVPLMWAGWVVCLFAAFFTIRLSVARALRRHLDPAREATVRSLTRSLPAILATAASLGWAVGVPWVAYLDAHDFGFGYYKLMYLLPVVPIVMVGAVVSGACWTRHRTCPPVKATS